MGGPVELTGPDLSRGIPAADLGTDGTLLGHAGGEPVLLVRRGGDILAIGATCTHYSGSLAQGLVVGESIVCPLHHACFDLRTGAASAPAFQPVSCWKVERRGADVFVTGKVPQAPRAARTGALPDKKVVILGGGAAGHSAAETLRREGYSGGITLVSADSSAPYDRTNVSKDYLAGTAPEEWMPMRPPDFYETEGIELRLGVRATAIDTAARVLRLETGELVPFDSLLLATGAEAVKLTIPGSRSRHVHTLRSLADARAIIARAGKAKKAVVLGTSFIGLEAAASLRARGIEVQVVSPDGPLHRVLGPEVGAWVRKFHEEHGVSFHIGSTATSIAPRLVNLSNGTVLEADLVVVGIGVRPSVALAEKAGLEVGNGVLVDEYLETKVPGIWAAGDIARWPEARTGRSLRVEHWVVAQRQGETAARNILGWKEPFTTVPFFWSQHYDVAIQYVGHAERWESAEVSGTLEGRDCVVAYREGGRITAVATIGRDRTNLEAEAAFARGDQAGLEALVRN